MKWAGPKGEVTNTEIDEFRLDSMEICPRNAEEKEVRRQGEKTSNIAEPRLE